MPASRLLPVLAKLLVMAAAGQVSVLCMIAQPRGVRVHRLQHCSSSDYGACLPGLGVPGRIAQVGQAVPAEAEATAAGHAGAAAALQYAVAAPGAQLAPLAPAQHHQ